MLKIALTGSHGFIGSNLSRFFTQQEYQVIPIPRGILYNLQALEAFLYENNPDFIINCASYGNMYGQNNEFETYFANTVIPLNLMSASRSINYKGFINFSSSSVMLPYETFYIASKEAGERLMRAFVNRYNKPVIAVRPFTVIGKGEQQEHLIPTLIQSCILGNKIDFVPDPVHDFIGINDFCEAILLLLPFIEGLKGQIIDIGTGKATTNDEIRQMVEKVTGKKAIINVVESMRPYDSKDWKANTAVLDYLSWKPKQTIEQIIEEMVKG